MRKAIVVKPVSEEEKREYESINDMEFSFCSAEELSRQDISDTALIIGDISPEVLKGLAERSLSSEEEKPSEHHSCRILNKPLILASASPRRKELLTKADIPFVVMPADIDESCDIEDPAEAAEEVSCLKAEYVADKLIKEEKRDAFVILSADTIVSIDGKILGKPKDEEEAFEVLKELQGRDHEVYTGVTIAVKQSGRDVRYRQFHEKTRVRIYPVSDEQIRDYISTGEPLDKAGSYAIQGSFAKYIKSIKGDYSNVVGLPVGRVFKELKQFLRK